MIDLGPAGQIDQSIQAFRESIGGGDASTDGGYIRHTQRLYELIFAPLKEKLGNSRRIFISPDSNLNLIPFEVFQGPDGRFLIEDYAFNYLPAGRDIIGSGKIESQGYPPVFMGDPDFDMRPQAEKLSIHRTTASYSEGNSGRKRSTEMRGLQFNPLPGTKAEVEALHTIFKDQNAALYTGSEAREEVLSKLVSPDILHLATHGFFLKNQDADISMTSRGLQLVGPRPLTATRLMRLENPLLRSGIALAGANQSLASRKATTSTGIVTAEKILTLNLKGTEMVVLSACETGLGKVMAGEGVFGLRRAFLQAGAKSLVMSMWPVPDEETKELMIDFYKKIRSGETNRCQALRLAVLKQLERVKQRYEHKNPFYWGAFVFMGEP